NRTSHSNNWENNKENEQKESNFGMHCLRCCSNVFIEGISKEIEEISKDIEGRLKG
ncbi:21930_t:CDS:1, partial [Racocetra persica]